MLDKFATDSSSSGSDFSSVTSQELLEISKEGLADQVKELVSKKRKTRYNLREEEEKNKNLIDICYRMLGDLQEESDNLKRQKKIVDDKIAEYLACLKEAK
ncbi:hypothetical protein CYMTET_10724 [Cymbomonas tetramitiformis]|uniref:Uncharacterized protein n=1 Tax=Cymbomonas tetramitiformis TaxID=36881 RepID=A0AAE0LE71_9CHLO|nr:hypothetical protein CYMTET_10724 [Cymbomonas tetramitiformis]